MDKRLIIAIALSLLVMLSWSSFVSKTQHIDNKGVIQQTLLPAERAPQKITPLPQKVESPSSTPLEFSSDNFEITFDESNAAIQEVLFKTLHNYKLNLQSGFLLEIAGLTFKKEEVRSQEITFVHSDAQKVISKKFIFPNYQHDIWLELKINNRSLSPLTISLPLVLGRLEFSAQNPQSRYQDVMVATKEKNMHLNARKNLDFSEVKFVGLRDRYFCAIIESEAKNAGAFISKITPTESEIGLRLENINLAPGQQLTQKFHIYLGPQRLQLINSINPEWGAIINYGTFDFIAQLLLQLLEFLHRIVHNWGWAIIILSLLVYLILYPLTLKQMRSMKEMQALQPKIEELRKAYKDNPQKLNKEIMELYREHKVSPLGGCLPLLLQMPIFFALYQALMRSVALRGAKFLWIKDLSEPDRLFTLPFSLPILGNEINILPILMTIGMFVQQKITTLSASSTSAEQQKIMMILMPLLFGFIFYRMPSGLVLYWFVNSTLMLLYQIRINRSK